jgi:hypothetical protein
MTAAAPSAKRDAAAPQPAFLYQDDGESRFNKLVARDG